MTSPTHPTTQMPNFFADASTRANALARGLAAVAAAAAAAAAARSLADALVGTDALTDIP